MGEFKGTKKEWHVVEFAGHYHFMDEPYYDAKDLMDEDDYNDLALHNATLACAAPELLACLQEYVFKDGGKDEYLLKTATAAINKALSK